MFGALTAIAIALQPVVEWVVVHEDAEAATSVDLRSIRRSGEHARVAVRTLFRDPEAGGFIHNVEVDCAAGRLRGVHETILDARGERVIDGPSLSREWMDLPEEAPFAAALRRACSSAR